MPTIAIEGIVRYDITLDTLLITDTTQPFDSALISIDRTISVPKTAVVIFIHSNAFFEASCAPAMSPWASFELTLQAYIKGIMPAGKQITS